MAKKKKNKAPDAPVIDTAALDAALEVDTTTADEQAEQEVAVQETDAMDAALEVEEQPAPVSKFKVLTEDEIVTDAKGNTLFKRKAPTTSSDYTPKTKPRTRMKDRKKLPMKSIDGAETNPAYLEWPSDRWGVTKDLKKAITDLGSRIAGDPLKKELADTVLAIGVAHLNAKFSQDNKFRRK